MKKILIRADSSSFIGTGHIMRCLVLAKKYKNSKIIFACQNLKGNINEKIVQSGYELEILNSNGVDELDSLIKRLGIEFLIIDHYGIDFNFEKEIKTKNKGLELLVFDDTYEKHFCDELLNHNPYAKTSKYKSLVPKNCKLLCGDKYILIRDEFKKEKRKFYSKNKKTKILITLGGSDYNNHSFEILELLKKVKNIEVFVVTTKANQNIQTLKKMAFLNRNFHVLINCDYMAKLINQVDFVIVAPSTTLYEVMYMKKRFIAIKTASNQDFMYEYLKKRNQMVLEKFEKNKVFYLIEKALRRV